MDFQRARSEGQIQKRIQEIIHAASAIYDSVGYEGLTFSAISEHTKFTRPNIYKYFKTKDEILLIILADDLKSCVASLQKSFKVNKLYSLCEIVEIWTNTLLKHERFLNLYALLFTTIEKNVSVKALSQFKKEMLKAVEPLFELILQLFPHADSSKVEDFIYVHFTFAVGLYPMSKLTDLQIEAIQLAELDYQPIDFSKTYMSVLYQLMYCLTHSIDIKKE